MDEQGSPVKRDWRMGQPDTASAVVVWAMVAFGAVGMFGYPIALIRGAAGRHDADLGLTLFLVSAALAFPLYFGAALRAFMGMLCPWSTWVWDEGTVARVAATPHVRGRFSDSGLRAPTPQRGVLLFESHHLSFVSREYVVWRCVVLGVISWVAAGWLAAICAAYLFGRRRVERRIDYRDVRAVDASSLQAVLEFRSEAGVEALRFRPDYGDRPRLREQIELHCPGALAEPLLSATPRHGDRARPGRGSPGRLAGSADLDRARRSLEETRAVQDAARRS